MTLDKQEQEILDSVERGEWKSVADRDEANRRYVDYSQATIQNDKRVNLRMSEKASQSCPEKSAWSIPKAWGALPRSGSMARY